MSQYSFSDFIYEYSLVDNKIHGKFVGRHKYGNFEVVRYYFYGKEVSEEEYKKLTLIEKITGK